MSSRILWTDLRSWLWDGDEFDVTVQPIDHGFLELKLRSSEQVTWRKELQLLDGDDRLFWSVFTQDDQHESAVIRIPAARDFLAGYSLDLCKAKALNFLTGMYRVPVLELNGGAIDGVRITFTWRSDNAPRPASAGPAPRCC